LTPHADRLCCQLGKFGTSEQKFIPWMQASYVMAANKKALQYLPEGAAGGRRARPRR
jgi:multiple sugar transport system substrate-binding protein